MRLQALKFYVNNKYYSLNLKPSASYCMPGFGETSEENRNFRNKVILYGILLFLDFQVFFTKPTVKVLPFKLFFSGNVFAITCSSTRACLS